MRQTSLSISYFKTTCSDTFAQIWWSATKWCQLFRKKVLSCLGKWSWIPIQKCWPCFPRTFYEDYTLGHERIYHLSKSLCQVESFPSLKSVPMKTPLERQNHDPFEEPSRSDSFPALPQCVSRRIDPHTKSLSRLSQKLSDGISNDEVLQVGLCWPGSSTQCDLRDVPWLASLLF